MEIINPSSLLSTTPTIPKFYWDVKSQEQRIKVMCCLIQQLIDQYGSTDSQIQKNSDDIAELQELFRKFQESGFDEYYEQQVIQWIGDNIAIIYQQLAKQVFFGLTSDGYFCAYVPDSWSDITFDTGAVYGTETYGRLVLRFDSDGSGVIDNSYDSSVLADTIDARLKAAARRGLEFDGDRLNVTDEWAVTPDGVCSYAPSKAETIEQPKEGEFTSALDGVTVTQHTVIRIGGLISFALRVRTNATTTIPRRTKFANAPKWITGIAVAFNAEGDRMVNIDSSGVLCSSDIPPNKDVCFYCICPYKG